MKDINKTTSKDILYAVTKAGLGSVPLAGAAASELLGLIVTPPLEKRRQKWMLEIGERLKRLEEKENIDLEGLSTNEQFIDTVLQATSLALKTSEKEKLIAFKNAISNTAIGEAPDKIKSQIFLTLLDSFTVWHLKILYFINDPKEWFKISEVSAPNFSMGSLSTVLKSAFPDLQDQDELLDVIWDDLHDAGFHRTSGLNSMMSGDGTLQNRTTNLGKEFLEFITNSEN